jgi:uncharacterized pyridoxamine 5'-phosphate oxidase family protein
MGVIENALKFLKTREFVEIATADKEGKPNSAPKLFLKTDGRIAYFIDYSIDSRTAENMKINSRVSLSFIDFNSLFGYKLNGKTEIIDKGAIYDECLKELRKREIELSVERITKGVHDGRPSKDFELAIPERFLIYKVKIEEGSEINPRGEIKRESS